MQNEQQNNDGRDPVTGRFIKGQWRGGPGNGRNRAVARIRAAFAQVVTEDDITAVVSQLVYAARAGEMWAVRELLNRTLGKPPTTVEIDGPPPVLEVRYVTRHPKVERAFGALPADEEDDEGEDEEDEEDD